MRPLPLAILFSLVFLPAADAAPRKKKAKPPPPPPAPIFQPGAEAKLAIRGDEERIKPGLTKVGLLDGKAHLYWQVGRYSGGLLFRNKSIKIGDPYAFKEEIRQGRLADVIPGTRVLVLESYQLPDYPLYYLPVDEHGFRSVRVLEGPHAGIILAVPALNLDPFPPKDEPKTKDAPEAKPKAK